MKTNTLRPRSGFTLIELVIVISIIVILVALFFPARPWYQRSHSSLQLQK